MRKKPWIIAVLVLAVVFGLTFTWDAIRSRLVAEHFANFTPPPPAVSTAHVKARVWHPTLDAVGTVVALQGVNVSAEVDGQVMEIFFQSGQMVEKGQPLIQLDDDVDQQVLNTDLAQNRLNELTYQRQFELYKTNSTSKSALDEAKAKMLQSQAAVAKDQVMINKKNVKAPFDGKLGIRLVDLGEYVSPGQAIVALQAMQPILVDFNLPGQDLPLLKVGQPVTARLQSHPDTLFKGKIYAINSKVDVDTRNIQVRAIFSNKTLKMYPGMFADVEVVLPEQKHVLTIPQTAVYYSLYGDSVFVIKKNASDNNASNKIGKVKDKPVTTYTVKQQFVKVGRREGNVVAVISGLKEGDQIVTSGQLKLQNGMAVTINNKLHLNGNVMQNDELSHLKD